LATSFGPGLLAWEREGPYVAGGAIVAAGIYELTPLKKYCLRRCRSPVAYHGEDALRVGIANGLYCVGCCLGLMAVLFALGVMSVLWMAVVAAVIFAEKVLPHGLRLPSFIAPALIVLGVCVALAPSSVPGLTQPDMAPSMRMEP
jgi:predicted metal-binding membrane protein